AEAEPLMPRLEAVLERPAGRLDPWPQSRSLGLGSQMICCPSPDGSFTLGQRAAVNRGVTTPAVPLPLLCANINPTTPPLFKKDLITSLIDYAPRINDHSSSPASGTLQKESQRSEHSVPVAPALWGGS
ncbi:hypothetical protein P4O66_013720, partial [Electrophorus voltai]